MNNPLTAQATTVGAEVDRQPRRQTGSPRPAQPTERSQGGMGGRQLPAHALHPTTKCDPKTGSG